MIILETMYAGLDFTSLNTLAMYSPMIPITKNKIEKEKLGIQLLLCNLKRVVQKIS